MSGPAPVLLEVRGLHVEPSGRGLFERRRSTPFALHAVDFELRAGETVAVLGPSGAGKSTLLRALLGLEPAARGEVRIAWQGRSADLLAARGGERRRLRQALGWIPQDPGGALDPRATVLESIAEPLIAHGRAGRSEALARARQLVLSSGLPGACAGRLPHELSGGERQRASVARALALDPPVLLLDEPTSSLDASVGAHVIDWIGRWVLERGACALWVSHDVALARWCSQRVLVLEGGRIVEQGATEELLSRPTSAAAKALVRAADWSQTLTE